MGQSWDRPSGRTSRSASGDSLLRQPKRPDHCCRHDGQRLDSPRFFVAAQALADGRFANSPREVMPAAWRRPRRTLRVWRGVERPCSSSNVTGMEPAVIAHEQAASAPAAGHGAGARLANSPARDRNRIALQARTLGAHAPASHCSVTVTCRRRAINRGLAP